MKRLLMATACLAALISPALAQPPGLWDHNGSAMRLVPNGNGGFGVYYEVIRPGLRVTIPQGAPRFEGQRIGNRLVGNAFVYTKYCFGKPFPYHVEGVIQGESFIELWGPAAVVDPQICQIVGHAPNSDNAHLVFHLVQPSVVVVPPPPVVVQPPPVVVQPPPPVVMVPTVPAPQNNNGSSSNSGGNTSGHVVPNGPVDQSKTIIINPTPPPPPPPPPRKETPDETAARLKREAQEFCWQYPAHPACEEPYQAPRKPSHGQKRKEAAPVNPDEDEPQEVVPTPAPPIQPAQPLAPEK